MKHIIRPRPPESGPFWYRISSGYLFTRIRVDGTLNHWERFHKCGFSEQILWFRVSVALQFQPITRWSYTFCSVLLFYCSRMAVIVFFFALALVQYVVSMQVYLPATGNKVVLQALSSPSTLLSESISQLVEKASYTPSKFQFNLRSFFFFLIHLGSGFSCSFSLRRHHTLQLNR